MHQNNTNRVVMPLSIKIGALICLLVMLFHWQLAKADWYKDLDGIFDDLQQVADAVKRKEYKKARILLDEVKRNLKWEKSLGLDYPNSVRNTVKHLETLVQDKLGELDTCMQMTGVITDVLPGASSGLIYLKRKDKIREFYFDAGMLQSEDCSWNVGTKVTIFYGFYGIDQYIIKKMICHK